MEGMQMTDGLGINFKKETDCHIFDKGKSKHAARTQKRRSGGARLLEVQKDTLKFFIYLSIYSVHG
jgi:hypothetical protein